MQTNRQNRRFCGTCGGRQMNKSLFKNHQTPTAAALGFLRHQGGESRSKGLRRKRGTRRGTVQLHHPVPHGAGTERQLVLFHLRAARGAIRAGTNSRKSAANNLTPPSKYPHSLRAVIWGGTAVQSSTFSSFRGRRSKYLPPAMAAPKNWPWPSRRNMRRMRRRAC